MEGLGTVDIRKEGKEDRLGREVYLEGNWEVCTRSSGYLLL